MGILGNWFSSSYTSGRNKKISFQNKNKLDRRDIHDLVWGIASLDVRQKKLIEGELIKQLDDAGVSKWEYEEIIRRLDSKSAELGLSEIDIKNLKTALY